MIRPPLKNGGTAYQGLATFMGSVTGAITSLAMMRIRFSSPHKVHGLKGQVVVQAEERRSVPTCPAFMGEIRALFQRFAGARQAFDLPLQTFGVYPPEALFNSLASPRKRGGRFCKSQHWSLCRPKKGGFAMRR